MGKTAFGRPLQTTLIVFLTLLLLWSCSFLGERKQDDAIPVEFDLDRPVGNFDGLGANVPLSFYSRRMKVLQTFNELGISHIRVKRDGENWDDILSLRSATSRLGIKWIYTRDEIPVEFQDIHGQLLDIKGFAGWWAEEVDELQYQDVPADYIELLDKPDLIRGDSVTISSDRYTALLHATRQELDLRDFDDVAIIGPALSTPSSQGNLETWYMDLDQNAYEMIPFWSVHAWDHQGQPGELGSALSGLLAYLDRIDSRKPVMLDAYASSSFLFNGIQYPDPDAYDVLGNQDTYETYYYSASFSMPYGLRVFGHTLDLLKLGDVIPFLHQLYDAPGDVKYKKQSWGLLDLDGAEKPVFTLLSSLMKRVPRRAEIIMAPDSSDGELNTLAFKTQDACVITILNEGLQSRHIRVSIAGAGKTFTPGEVILLYTPEPLPPEMGKMDHVQEETLELKSRYDSGGKRHVFSLDLQPQSVFIGEFGLR